MMHTKYEETIEQELEKAACQDSLETLKSLVEKLPEKIPRDLLSNCLPEHREWKRDEWLTSRLSSVLSAVGQKGKFDAFAYLLTETKADVQWIWGFERIGWNHIEHCRYTRNHLCIAQLIVSKGLGDPDMWEERVKEVREALWKRKSKPE